jgi:DNA polymerase-1
MATHEKVTLLLDSDIIAYQIASVNQQDIDWGDDIQTRSLNLHKAIEQAEEIVESLLDKLQANTAIVCLTDKTNWRKEVLPTYKSNRSGVEKPELLNTVKDYLAGRYDSFIRPSLEADDVMGILSTHPTLIPGKKIIVSEDKDMKTIPGWLFNPRKDDKPKRIREEEADRYHLYQALIGDSTDGYKGCPGVGPKGADKVLDSVSPSDWWRAVVEQYEKKGLTEGDALVQARVARICRADDYDFKKKDVLLWNPRED